MKKKLGKKTKRAVKAEVDSKFAPVAQAFAGIRGVSGGKLFSSYGLKVSGKIFAMFGRGRLVVKLPKERVDGLVSAGKGERFDPGQGRVMKEWIATQTAESEWIGLAREAYEFVKQGKA
jgi:TfoX/Sxy family transcriptional regulator of competence genes